MILYIEDPKDYARTLLEFINEYIKVTGYKINTRKSPEVLYTNNEKSERLRQQSLPKESKDLYAENFKILMKEIRNDAKQMERYTMFFVLEESIL